MSTENQTTDARSEVEVMFTDFNGHSWDGNPFSHCPPWLMAAVTRRAITPAPDDRDYSPFAVETQTGIEIAYAGDRIGFDGEYLYVRRA